MASHQTLLVFLVVGIPNGKVSMEKEVGWYKHYLIVTSYDGLAQRNHIKLLLGMMPYMIMNYGNILVNVIKLVNMI
jgi:hypothetical protein